MKTYLFLAIGWAMILAFKKEKRQRITRNIFLLMEEILFLSAASLLLILIFSAILALNPAALTLGTVMARQIEIKLFAIWASAYGLRLLLKKGNDFFLVLFGLTIFIMTDPLLFSIPVKITAWACFTLGVLIFEIFILGLKEHLLLTPVPKSLSGFPLFFVTTSLLSLALTGLLAIFMAWS
ncbi:MAG: hypothetical protein HYZ83_00715 [Candidatus Omnitrophica bacterium]|nr:hypothetical protein [Candidatus Omnitrophota bacterium]